MQWTYDQRNRAGDHIWWISDTRKFERHYPGWRLHYDVRRILQEIREIHLERHQSERIPLKGPAVVPAGLPASA